MDGKYRELLCKIFGKSFIDHFQQQYPTIWLQMMIDFEKKKRASDPHKERSTNLCINMTFAMEYKKFTNRNFESALTCNSKEGVTFSSAGLMCISATTMAKLFQDVLGRIGNHIEQLLQQQAVGGVKYIFLVGGFSESAHLKNMIHRKFGNDRVILTPEEPSLCVLKGAVLYGHLQNIISSRAARFSYAVQMYREFIENSDDVRRKEMMSGLESVLFLLQLQL